MADAHGCSVVETNKVNVCVVVGIYAYLSMFRAYIYCNTMQSKCHKTQMIIFISYSAHFTGVWAESREASCYGGELLHFNFYIQLLFLHTNVIDAEFSPNGSTCGVPPLLLFVQI